MPRGEVAGEFALTSADSATQWVKLSVSDTGPGIPESELEKIFERYYQVDRTGGGSYNFGSGIGLYYARALAELHHGRLKAGNRTDGVSGAVFTLILPASDSAYGEAEIDRGTEAQDKAYPLGGGVASDAASSETETGIGDSVNASESGEETAAKGKPTVLVVDDDADVVHYLKTLLSDRYRVLCRFDAEGALEIMEKDVPDVIVCDVMMPGKDGYELCREVKDSLQLCHIPVILLTAKVGTQDVVTGLDSGAEAYITKPFEPAVLLSAIGSQLKNRERISLMLNSSTTVVEIEGSELSPQDKAFMDDLYRLMEEEITNSELNVVGMAE
ncbi:MAG: response regulator, partial [Bacteroidales bacterium]|nr:response regulator [Bacteroidales bacterium]